MAISIEPFYDESEPQQDWCCENQRIIFRANAGVLRIQAAYQDEEELSDNYRFATEISKEEAVKLAKAILVEFNAL